MQNVNLKSVEKTYNWKPEDGDYSANIELKKNQGLYKFLNKCGLEKINRIILMIVLKYFILILILL
jgi:hypothetical protein